MPTGRADQGEAREAPAGQRDRTGEQARRQANELPCPTGPPVEIAPLPNEEAEEDCSLCLAPLPEPIDHWPGCGHRTHSMCARGWMTSRSGHPTCPQCRLPRGWGSRGPPTLSPGTDRLSWLYVPAIRCAGNRLDREAEDEWRGNPTWGPVFTDLVNAMRQAGPPGPLNIMEALPVLQAAGGAVTAGVRRRVEAACREACRRIAGEQEQWTWAGCVGVLEGEHGYIEDDLQTLIITLCWKPPHPALYHHCHRGAGPRTQPVGPPQVQCPPWT